MHVLNTCFLDGSAGTERAFIEYTHALIAEGMRVTALIHPESPYLDELARTGISILPSARTGPPHHTFEPSDTLYFRHVLEDVRPDVIVAHSSSDITQLKLAAEGHTPFTAVIHNLSSVPRCVGADATIVLEDVMRRRVEDAGQPLGRIFKVPNMIDVPEGAASMARVFRDPPVIGVLARLARIKGVDRFIEALAILQRQEIRFEAVIGGDGGEQDDLEEQVERLGLAERVRFLGWVTDSRRFFASIDLFCLPSRAETFGIVLLEAAVQSVPIVCTDTDGAREVIVKDETGVLIARDDPEALARGLAALLRDQEAARRLARAGFRRTAERYSRQVVAPEVRKVLETARSVFESRRRQALKEGAGEASSTDFA